jgi:hypothetical protein
MVSKKRIGAAMLAGFLALTLSACERKNYTEEDRIRIESSDEYKNFEFGIGEHIMSIPLDKDPCKEVRQLDYHPGYKITGIGSSSSKSSFEGACVLYVNTLPVICHGSGLDRDGNIIYANFGDAIGYVKPEEEKSKFLKKFYEGEHILCVPIDHDPGRKNRQYQYREGYEAVGIATTSDKSSFDGGCIVYVNTVPVTCSLTEEKGGKEYYLSFGIPAVEKTK